MKAFTVTGFILVAIVHWYVPLSMVKESEDTLTEGDELLFRTRPVDPSDPFRGKYVSLDFEEEQQVLDTVPQYFAGQEVYASFTIDSAGFADLDSLFVDDPGNDLPWVLKVRVNSSYSGRYTIFSLLDSAAIADRQSVQLEFPFKRFYLEESKASDAEKAYWESTVFNSDSLQTRSYAVVKIKGRRAVLKDVRINDKSIVDIVREMNEED